MTYYLVFWPWPPYSILPRSCLTWIFFVYPHWWVTLCVQCPAKAMPFQQIIMHALQCQHGVDVHLFCLTLTSIDLLFPSSCITWILFVDSHLWVPLCVQHPTIYMPFWQIVMYILQCPHDIHVHLFCYDLHKFLLRSRAVTCPTSNCGRGTSLFRQELVYTKRKYTNSWTHFLTMTQIRYFIPLFFYNFLHGTHVHNSNPLFVLIAYNIFVIYLLNYLFNIKTWLIYLLEPYTQHRTLWYSRAYDRLIWSPSYSGLRFRIRFPLQLSITNT